MHRSETKGRFGEAEPEGRASVCAERTLAAIGVSSLHERHDSPYRKRTVMPALGTTTAKKPIFIEPLLSGESADSAEIR